MSKKRYYLTEEQIKERITDIDNGLPIDTSHSEILRVIACCKIIAAAEHKATEKETRKQVAQIIKFWIDKQCHTVNSWGGLTYIKCKDTDWHTLLGYLLE